MSKKQYIKRHILIINKLRKKACSFDEIQNHLLNESSIDEENYEISIRTFQRDIKEIASIYNIEISSNRSLGVYEISHDGNEDRNERLIESLEVFNALNLTSSFSNQIIFEKRQPLGTENMHGLIHAIKNHFEIGFLHENFGNGNEGMIQRNVQPLALKESRHRWYLLAKDNKDNKLKTFSLDRIADLQIGSKKFNYQVDFNPEEIFRYSFGVINSNDVPRRIVLSFTHQQGKYIKSLPLHHSQKIIIDDENEVRIELFLNPTHDFAMELLSMGNGVKVLEPEYLRAEIKRKLKEALENYL